MMTLALTNSRRNWLGWMPFPAWAEARRSGFSALPSPVRLSLCISAVIAGPRLCSAWIDSVRPSWFDGAHHEGARNARLLRMRTFLSAIMKSPHPEQAARWAARRRTHLVDAVDQSLAAERMPAPLEIGR